MVASETFGSRQLVINTSSLERFSNFVDVLLELKRGDSAIEQEGEQESDKDEEFTKDEATMAAVTGKAGIGKTVAMRETVRKKNKAQSHTGLPPVCTITVLPRSRPITIAKALAKVLDQEVSGKNETDEVIADICELIERNDLRLIIVDEADLLDKDCFNVLRSIFDITQCPIMLIGLPNLLTMLEKHDQFNSRVGLRMLFEILSEDEVINTFLPSMSRAYSKWKYDANDQEDVKMGKFLWNKVKPSLRKLRSILRLANRIACQDKAAKISLDHIKESMKFALGNGGSEEDSDDQDSESDDTEEGSSEFEIQSQERNDARQKRKKGSK
jgi:Cdc6-like AAA superfamily ATPase